LDVRLQTIVDELLQWVDVSLTSGHRGQEEQDELYRTKKSKLKYPKSKHNSYPSLAVDLQPYPYPENEHDLRAALGYIAGLSMMIAHKYGWKLRWGGDWDSDGSVVDNGFDDLYHLELVNAEDTHTSNLGDGAASDGNEPHRGRT
jgi:peptidoglycan L-alanyl-D-glutamate endopeptidase CwlK